MGTRRVGRMMGTRLAEELCIITNVDDVDEANARERASVRDARRDENPGTNQRRAVIYERSSFLVALHASAYTTGGEEIRVGCCATRVVNHRRRRDKVEWSRC